MKLALVAVMAIAAAACTERQVLLQGDAQSAVVTYSGDPAASAGIAERHCAAYGKIAKLAAQGLDTAYFECLRR